MTSWFGGLVTWGVFAVFALLCVVAWWSERWGETSGRGRTVVLLLVTWGVAISCVAGFADRHAWPFVSWVLMPDAIPAEVAVLSIVAVDARGGTFRIDHRVWAPLAEEELMAWIRGPFARLDEDGRDEALTELLRMAEEGRLRVRAGGGASSAPGLLGSLGASTHLLHPDRWRAPADTPASPFVELWVVEDRWNVLERRAGSGVTARTVLHRSERSPPGASDRP